MRRRTAWYMLMAGMRTVARAASFFGRLGRWWLPETTPPRLLLYFVGTLVFVAGWALWGLFAGVGGARNAPLALCVVGSSATALAIFFLMSRPDTDGMLQRRHRRLLMASRAISAMLVMATVVTAVIMVPWIYTDGNVKLFGRFEFQPATSDALAMTHQANEMVLDGRNPYGHTNVITAMENFTTVTPTILRQGAFADAYPMPTDEQMDAALEAAKANPDAVAAEFESTLSYPAGAFLLRLPTDALGIPPQWFYLLCVVLMGAVITWRAPAHLRPVAAVGCAASLLVWNSHLGGGTDALYLLFVLLGWTLRKRPFLSAGLIGMAATCKQTAWFFIPFYLVLVLREAGWRRAAQSLSVIGAAFFLVNAPFIASDPGAWITGMLAPMTHPLFPYGIGVVSFAMLSHSPVPSAIFTALEAVALAVTLYWYYRHCRQAPEAGLVLAVVPLFFAWRSLIAYFVTVPLAAFGAALAEQAHRGSALQGPALAEQPVAPGELIRPAS